MFLASRAWSLGRLPCSLQGTGKESSTPRVNRSELEKRCSRGKGEALVIGVLEVASGNLRFTTCPCDMVRTTRAGAELVLFTGPLPVPPPLPDT